MTNTKLIKKVASFGVPKADTAMSRPSKSRTQFTYRDN